MSLYRVVRTILNLDLRTKLLFLETYLSLGWARCLIRFKFSWVAPSLGMQQEESPLTVDEAHLVQLRRIYDALHIVSRHTFWESKCLVKAIAGMRMLSRRGISSTLYLGTAKDEHNKLIAHAWLRSGPYYITGAENKDSFTVVSKFAKGHE